ncbi:MAG TPA: hypothetical protein VFS00_25165 [Polyangiaceae bacterium]|nr:hypothetical protein [Polyangiaceae bacterium]
MPYSALTKALSDGLLGGGPLPGLALLPLSNVASMRAVGWWKYAGRSRLFGAELPRASRCGTARPGPGDGLEPTLMEGGEHALIAGQHVRLEPPVAPAPRAASARRRGSRMPRPLPCQPSRTTKAAPASPSARSARSAL